jgi:putative DNA primase/helicase
MSEKPSDDEEIARLAALDPVQYDREREAAARQLGIRKATLDNRVDALRRKWEDAATRPESSEGFLEPSELWPEPVDSAELLNDIERAIERYVVLPSKAGATGALWTLFAHAHEAAPNSPTLALQSPEKRCGKTTALAVLSYLVPRAVPAANVSSAALYRSVELFRPTLLIDEGDSFLGSDKDEMRGILNSGFTRATAFVLRCAGEDSIPTPFRTWCPKVIP